MPGPGSRGGGHPGSIRPDRADLFTHPTTRPAHRRSDQRRAARRREYLPAAAQTDAELAVPIAKLTSLLGDPTVIPVPVPHDCVDGFGGAYWRRPHAYLDAAIQTGMSLFALTPKPALREGLARLHADLASGTWDRQHQDLLDLRSWISVTDSSSLSFADMVSH